MSEPRKQLEIIPVEYRDIPGLLGYRVSSVGTVWSCLSRSRPTRLTDKWKKLKLFLRDDGRLAIVLSKNKQPCALTVCRIVLSAFVGPCPGGMEACHYPDSDPRNNWIGNLRWDTKRENNLDKFRHLRMQNLQKCCVCDMVKPFEEFTKGARRASGRASQCRECNAKYLRAWRKEKKHGQPA